MKGDHQHLLSAEKEVQVESPGDTLNSVVPHALGTRPAAANDAHVDFLLFVRAFARANAARDSREWKAANDNDTRSDLRPL
jgi:hypothetical protein